MTARAARSTLPRGAVAAILLGAGLVCGCSRPSGDFERPQPTLLHDSILPFAGEVVAAYGRGEPVSGFHRTDREETLRDRAFALVAPPHTRDWVGDILVEGQRSRLLPEIDQRYNTHAYWNLLRTDAFRSTEARWSRLADDMAKDAMLVGPFWSEARGVAAADRARLAALDARHDLAAHELADAYARIDENARVLGWVWRAMRFRLVSYRVAIDRLAVETPTERLPAIEAAWRALEIAILEAERGTANLAARPIAPRHARPWQRGEEPVPQK